jgi:hypothetical protein
MSESLYSLFILIFWPLVSAIVAAERKLHRKAHQAAVVLIISTLVSLVYIAIVLLSAQYQSVFHAWIRQGIFELPVLLLASLSLRLQHNVMSCRLTFWVAWILNLSPPGLLLCAFIYLAHAHW